MKYVLDFNNTGFIIDGVLTINTDKNELGYPDGTIIAVSKYDENNKLIAQKEIDVEDLFGIPDKDEVTIICYNSERKMPRNKAIEEFESAICGSEGSEQERYCSIVSGLKAGKKVVDDEWRWCR